MRHPLLLALALLAACQTPPPAVPGVWEKGNVVATVDGQNVTDEVIWASIAGMIPPDQLAQVEQSGQSKDILEQVLRTQALYKRALEQKLMDDPEVQAQVALAARQPLIRAMLQKIQDDAVTDDAVQKLYDERKVQYATAGVKFKHIVVKDEAKALELKAALDAGADFLKVAEAESLDKNSIAQPAEWIAKGQLSKVLDDALFADAATGVLGPFNLGDAYILVNVTERRDSTPLDDVREELASTLKQQAIETYLSALEKDVKIEWKGDLPPLSKPEGGAAAPAATDAPAAPAAPEAPATPDAPAAPAAPEAGH